MKQALIDVARWSRLMGRDLKRSELQPLQTVRVERDNTVEITVESLRALGFSPGDRVQVELRDGGCVLQRLSREGGVMTGARQPSSTTFFAARRRTRPIPR